MTSVRTRTGANELRSGKETRRSAGSTPFRVAACRAMAAARARYSPLPRWRGLGAPFASRTGAKRRGKSSRRERAPDSAARSTARCARDAPVAAPPSAASTAATKRTTNAAPIVSGSAWPCCAAGHVAGGSSPRARRDTRRADPPPTSSPASARREATSPSGREATLTGSRRSRSSITARAASGRSSARSARSSPARNGKAGSSRAASHNPAGTWTIETAGPAASRARASSSRDSSASGSPSQHSLPRAAACRNPSSRSSCSRPRALAEASVVGPRPRSAPISAMSTRRSPEARPAPTAAATARPPLAPPRSVASSDPAPPGIRTASEAARCASALIRQRAA